MDTQKLVKWLIFGAIVSILPLVFTYVTLLLKSQPSLSKVLGGGELFLITWVLSASAFGELLPGSRDQGNSPIIAGGLVLILSLFSALLYVLVIDDRASIKPEMSDDMVTLVSIVVFIGSFGASTACIAISAKKVR